MIGNAYSSYRWKACRIPDFLQRRDRSEEPVRSIYWHNDDGTPGEIYFRHQHEYELTVLRTAFLERMSQVNPLWTKIYETSGQKLDLCYCVESCDNELCFKMIRKWLDNQAAGGEYYSLLHEVMQ